MKLYIHITYFLDDCRRVAGLSLVFNKAPGGVWEVLVLPRRCLVLLVLLSATDCRVGFTFDGDSESCGVDIDGALVGANEGIFFDAPDLSVMAGDVSGEISPNGLVGVAGVLKDFLGGGGAKTSSSSVT